MFNENFKSIFCVGIICFSLLLCGFVKPVNAMPNSLDGSDTAMQLIDEYMTARENLINENMNQNWTTFSVEGVYNDEKVRAELMKNLKIFKVRSTFQIIDINVSDVFTDVNVTETIRYDNSAPKVVNHEITIMLQKNGSSIILSDSYKEEYIGFTSCSYVVDDGGNAELNAVASWP